MYKHLEKLINNYDKRKGKLIEKEVFKTSFFVDKIIDIVRRGGGIILLRRV